MDAITKAEKPASQALVWPYLTAEIPGFSATVKVRDEDFRVEEIPAYVPSGKGDHTYCWIEKTGVATPDVLRELSRGLGISPRTIGAAGLKDRRAVTCQWISLERVPPEALKSLQIRGVKFLEITRHKNKLRIGHLLGNRFVIKLRETEPGRLSDIQAALVLLANRGLPNYFGPQRFGAREDNWEIGRALVRRDWESAAAIFAGRPRPCDTGVLIEARAEYDRGHYREAAGLWPHGFRDIVRLCRVMEQTGGDAQRAIMRLDSNLLWFYISAFQSWLFNQVIQRRIGTLSQVMKGDLAYKHDNGAVFLVEDPGVENERAGQFEISPSGPLFGYKMTQPGGEPYEIEQAVLSGAGIAVTDFCERGALQCRGARRSLRVRVDSPSAEAGRDEHGDFIELKFSLPAGTYATSVLREICKGRLKFGSKEEEARE